MRLVLVRRQWWTGLLPVVAVLVWIAQVGVFSAGREAGVAHASESAALAGCKGLVNVDEGVSLQGLDEKAWTRAGSGTWWVEPGGYTIDARYVGAMGRVNARDKSLSVMVVSRHRYMIHSDLDGRPFIAQDVTGLAWEPARNPEAEAALRVSDPSAAGRVHLVRREQQSGRAYFFCDSVPLAWSADRGQTAFSILLPAGPHCLAAGSKTELKEGQCEKEGLRLEVVAGQETFLEIDTKKSRVLRLDEAAGLALMKTAVYLTFDRIHPAFGSDDPCVAR